MVKKLLIGAVILCLLFIGLYLHERDVRVETELKLEQVSSELQKQINYTKDVEKEKESINSKFNDIINSLENVQNECGKEKVPAYLLNSEKKILGVK